MSSRGGRGYSRRGGNGNNNYRSSGYRGGNQNNRSSNSSYDDRSYSNNGYNNRSYDSSRSGSDRYYSSSGQDRYSGRNNDGYNNYKRQSDYGNSRDRSDDRKRSRHDAQASRRNHDYGGGSSNYNNYDKRDQIRSSRRSPAASSSSSTRRFRNDSSSRRSRERMGPPKNVPLRSRNGFRGRGTNTRGLRSRILPRRTDMRTGIRKRYIPMIKSREYAKKLKLMKLRRETIRKRPARRRSRSPTEGEKKERKDNKDDKSASKDDDTKKSSSSKKDDSVADNDSEMAEKTGEDAESGKKSPTLSVTKENGADGEDGVDDEVLDDTIEKGDDEKNASKKSIDDEDVAEETKSKKDDDRRRSHGGRSFIKLICIHCNTESKTFKEYSQHIHYRTHKIAMKKLSLRQKAQLLRMRQSQRNAQRELEEKCDEKEKGRAQFCPLCRLNYRQPKVKHQLSEGHRNMKKFLMPYCRVCRLAFKSPMMYEAHRCSLEHIKRKARKEGRESDGEDTDINLENFMTVDSIGHSDGNDNDEEEGLEGAQDKTENVNVGEEHVKKVDAHWCDLCRVYLPYQEEFETSLKRHCANRSHLRAYLRYRDDKTLRKTAELVHRRLKESKEDKDTDASGSKLDDSKGGHTEENEGEDDKMWADVDKDLGDLLKEVNPENGNADEEDEDSHLNAERYDRFKNSEKGIDKIVAEGEEETKNVEEEAEISEEVAKIDVVESESVVEA